MRDLGRLRNSELRAAIAAMEERARADGLICPTENPSPEELRRRLPAGYARNCIEAAAMMNEDFRPWGPPTDPCPFPPGSREKVAAMARRIEEGQALFHPSDRLAFDTA